MQAPSAVGFTVNERLLMFWQHKKTLVICFASVILIGIVIVVLFVIAQAKTIYNKVTGATTENTSITNLYTILAATNDTNQANATNTTTSVLVGNKTLNGTNSTTTNSTNKVNTTTSSKSTTTKTQPQTTKKHNHRISLNQLSHKQHLWKQVPLTFQNNDSESIKVKHKHKRNHKLTLGSNDKVNS